MIKIECIYFKESGKFYSREEGEFSEDLFEGCIYPRDYGRRLQRLKLLPGLIRGQWDYYFTITVDGKYPELILPEKP